MNRIRHLTLRFRNSVTLKMENTMNNSVKNQFNQHIPALFVLVLATLVTPVLSFAQVSPPAPPESPDAVSPSRQALPGRFVEGRQYLTERWDIEGLSDEQREKIKAYHLESQPKITTLQNQLQEKRARLQTVSTGTTVNRKEAMSVIEDIARLEGEISKIRWETRDKVRSVLTEEQRILFDARMGRTGQMGRSGVQGSRNGQRGQMNHQGQYNRPAQPRHSRAMQGGQRGSYQGQPLPQSQSQPRGPRGS